MNKLKLLTVGLAATTTMTAASCAEQAPPPLPYDVSAPISGQDVAVVDKAFNQTKQFWTMHDVGVMAITLAVIRDGQTYSCSDRYISVAIAGNDPDGLRYCTTTQQVLMTQAGLNKINYMVDQSGPDTPKRRRQLIEVIIGHEIGHGIQMAHNVHLSSDDGDDRMQHTAELQADCLAGASVTAIDEDAFIERSIFFGQLAPVHDESTHGSRYDREAAFVKGAFDGAGACGIAGVYTPPTIT